MDCSDKSRDELLRELAVSRESEEKHRSLFETVSQGVVYQDAEGHILLANPAAERILGLSLAQMQGRTSTDPRWKAIHEDGSDFHGETHPSIVALRTGKLVHNVVMGIFNPKTDDHTWINVDAIPQFRPEQETPFQVYTVFEDITERKEAERKLREAAIYLDTMGDALLVLDAQLNVIKVNKAAMKLWGYDTKEEPIGLNLTGMFPERTLSRHYAEMKEAVDTDSVRPFETVALTKDGNEIPVLIHGTVMKDAGGKLLGFVGVFRDITERKRLEEALVDITEEERERLRRDLHDSIGQQLTGLRLLVAALRGELSATHPVAADHASQIEQIAGDALNSVWQVAKGLAPIPEEPDALATALRELAHHTNDLYGFRCQFTSREPVLIPNPDTATHLFLIAQEAVANAVKHAKPGRITISLSERNSTLRLVVKDDGVGFSGKEQHEGMGMNIMRSRATLIGASLDVQGGKAGGTVVTCSWKKTPPLATE